MTDRVTILEPAPATERADARTIVRAGLIFILAHTVFIGAAMAVTAHSL